MLDSRFILICHTTSGPKCYKIVKHEHPGTKCWSIIPITICNLIFVGKIIIWSREFTQEMEASGVAILVYIDSLSELLGTHISLAVW